MSNHFHLVIETPQGNLVAGMKWLLGWGFKPAKQRPPWLRVDRVLGEAGIPRDTSRCQSSLLILFACTILGNFGME